MLNGPRLSAADASDQVEQWLSAPAAWVPVPAGVWSTDSDVARFPALRWEDPLSS